MTSRSRKRPNSRQLRALCADLSPEDGVDPRHLARAGGEQTDRRKAWQLCSQVRDSLRLILGTAVNERLQALDVREVLPAPNESQLLVLLTSNDPLDEQERQEVLDALGAAAGWLRAEVATSITRKRAPRLELQLLPS
ncbi:ribosome-binding factor A [Anatilimnocola floriformis]|uniref:ribosome-binding factor A n=1 Tax=Anatilimnocola floriformis TaxID=2948575 RepID=UPI0020C3B8ED|nr:ribosome-binding factor A [Anatilimnocola floriformis]